MKSVFWLLLTTLFISPLTHAEDFERLSPLSFNYLKNLVPADRQTASPELLHWYELMQALQERSQVLQATTPTSQDPDDALRVNSYATNTATANDAEVQRLTAEIRRVQNRIQPELKREELMMWYAPNAYLQSISNFRHRQYLERFGWSPQTPLGHLVGRDDYVRNLAEMHPKRHGYLSDQGWSETFWPDFTGSIDVPYAAPNVHLSFINFIWLQWNDEIMALRPGVERNVARRNPRSISPVETAALSAAEKYDLLVGDLEFTFSKRVRQMVQQIRDDGMMAVWTGICDGWSAASLHYFRPEQPVDVTGALGHTIRFHPTDIKGLASFLWAKSFDRAGANLTFGAGYQCQRGGDKDSVGRLLDPTCNDINPAYFHIAAVNLIGLDRHGFVFDRSHGANVMNQPAYEYNYSYFNPATLNDTENMEEAKRPLGTFRDPFTRYRSRRATHLVGVKMRLWYKKEHEQPLVRERDNAETDRNHTVDLRYDLELDAAGNIVGGEWWFYRDIFRPNLVDSVNDSHPDTLWLVAPGAEMYATANEAAMPMWASGQSIPAGLLPFHQAAARTMKPPFGPNDSVQHPVYRPQPLPAVVERLVELSRPGRTRHKIARVPGRYRNTFCGRWDEATGQCKGWTDAEWLYESQTRQPYPF